MLIVDKKTDCAIIRKLEAYDTVFCLETSGITYDAISGHPDIFFCLVNNKLIHATNLPAELIQSMKVHLTEEGTKAVGSQYPFSAPYNAVVTSDYLIHNTNITDQRILEHSKHKQAINVRQGYTRCNLLVLDNRLFITSDQGIAESLNHYKLQVIYFDPSKIRLPGFEHGFFGGCCGIIDHRVLMTGSLKYHKNGKEVKRSIEKLNYELIELSDEPLFDGGSIIHIPQ